MSIRTNDARGFVEGVVRHLKFSEDGQTRATEKIRSLLYKMTATAKGERIARVDSTVLLTQSQKVRLQKILSTFSAHPVELEYGIDRNLIAGFRIRMGDWIIDTSLQNQIDELAHTLF